MPTILDFVFPAPLWQELRHHLIRVDDDQRPGFRDEQLAFVLAAHNSTTSGVRLVAHELLLAGAEDLAHQGPGGIGPTGEFVAKALSRCRSEGWSLIEVHSHPFDGSSHTTFSGIDWANDEAKMPRLASMLEHHATMVLGQRSQDAHYFDKESLTICPVPRLTLVGDVSDGQPQLAYLPFTSSNVQRTFAPEERHHRQIPLIGAQTQELLAGLSVVIVGLGGLGSFVALELAHLGIGHLILIDPDTIEETNLNRLLGATLDDVGRSKVDVFCEMIKRIAPEMKTTAMALSIFENAALAHAKSADVIMGCVDNHGARLMLNHLSVRYVIPLLDAGTGARLASDSSEARVGGQVQLVAPGTGCLECRGFIDARRAAFDLASPDFQEYERAHGYGTDDPAPSVVFLNGVVASVQVAELVRLITAGGDDSSANSIVVYDALAKRMFAASSRAPADCVTCGADGAVGVADMSPLHQSASSSVMLQEGMNLSSVGVPSAGTDTDE